MFDYRHCKLWRYIIRISSSCLALTLTSDNFRKRIYFRYHELYRSLFNPTLYLYIALNFARVVIMLYSWYTNYNVGTYIWFIDYCGLMDISKHNNFIKPVKPNMFRHYDIIILRNTIRRIHKNDLVSLYMKQIVSVYNNQVLYI